MTRFFITCLCISLWSGSVFAQTALSFSGIQTDRSEPIEVSSDALSLDQTNGWAVFESNVIVGQGDLRLTADRIVVSYTDDGGIQTMDASGNVVLVTQQEAAEANTALYNLEAGTLTMKGDVMVTQGASAVMADAMVVDLDTGNANLTGRVRSLLQQDN